MNSSKAVFYSCMVTLVIVVLGVYSTAQAAGFTDVSVIEAQALIKKTKHLVIIDVSPAFARGHLPGAVNYPLGDGSLDEILLTLDKSNTYLVYCHADTATIKGAQKMIDAGFKKVYRMTGNYQGWVDAGYPVEK